MLTDFQARFTIERSGGDRNCIAVKTTPEKRAATVLTKAALGGIRGFEPFEAFRFIKSYVRAFCI